MRKLQLSDIKDTREYERERDDFRRHVIALKQRRRIPLGTIMTIVFENRDTMRFQVQEMARAERMSRDEQVEHEIETYNALIPEPGELSATLLIELQSEAQLREWLPKLVGVHEHVVIALADGTEVRGVAEDADRLTREDTTPAVHFLKFHFTPQQIDAFEAGPARIVVDHPAYREDVELTDAQRQELLEDLRELTDMQIFVQRLDPDLPLPGAQHTDDAGFDLYARQGAELEPGGGRAAIPTGIALAIPPGYAGFVQPRSGLALRHGVTCLNTPGLIDAGYRDEIRVLLVNTDPSESFSVQRGDRIAQLVVQKVEAVTWAEVDHLDASERGRSGWGSTGAR